MDNILKLQHFFSVDMNIKRELINLCPPDDYVDEESMVKYIDRAYESLEYIYTELKCITLDYLGEKSILYNNIVDMEKYVKDSFINAGTSIDKLKKLYEEFISNMDVKFVDLVKKECVAYSMFSSNDSQSKAKSINEMLHYLHSCILNNEYIFQGVPSLASKINKNNNVISYRGVSNQFFNDIYNLFPLDLNVGITDILCLGDNKLIMMIRDRGHALTMEVSIKNNIARVEYFIPKLCNIDMINALPGINKVDKDKATINGYGATGVIEVNKEDLTSVIYDFISRVPTDFDMVQDFNFRR